MSAPVSVALLKGRANYVCHFHLERTLQNGRLTSREDVGYLREISRFIKTTSSGDKAELSKVPETALVWNLATSTRDTCLGAECQYYQDCFVMKARKEAQQADVVVVNHHLFFADVALKDTGVAELLPSANTIIFDEAHQLPETATLFFGDTISTSMVIELCRDVQAEGLAHARDGADWAKVTGTVDRAARDLRLTFPQDVVRLALGQIAPSSPFFPALENLKEKLREMIAVLENQAERAETIEQCRQRALALEAQLTRWNARGSCKAIAGDDERVLWVEAFASSLQLHQTPLSIAPIFNKQREGSARAWIFTSATLAVKNDFNHYVSQMGLSDCVAKSWPSPFDYQNQGLLYVPQNLPQPNSLDYTDAVIDAALPMIEASGGRCFLLCTTIRAVNRAADRLREEFEKRGLAFPLFVQGDRGRTELLDQFRKAGNGVLIGSQSFWEGVDVRGEALSLVIIDKLPFAPPDDPVLAARIDVMQRNGERLHASPAAGRDHQPEAGRRPPDPRRTRSRRADDLRSAPDFQTLRQAHLAKPAAIQADPANWRWRKLFSTRRVLLNKRRHAPQPNGNYAGGQVPPTRGRHQSYCNDPLSDSAWTSRVDIFHCLHIDEMSNEANPPRSAHIHVLPD